MSIQDSIFFKKINKHVDLLLTVMVLLATLYIMWQLPEWLDTKLRAPYQQLVTAIWTGSIYSLFALGYALVFSILGLLNLSHSAIFMWGGYCGWYVVDAWGWSIWMALPAGMIGAGVLSMVVDLVAFMPLRQRNAPRIAQLISSLGAAAVLVNLAQLLFTAQDKGFPRELRGDLAKTDVYFEGTEYMVRIAPIQFIILGVSLALMILLQVMIARTRTGKAMRVVAFNQKIAQLLGINVGNIFRLTFFLSGALAGAAGVLYGMAFTNPISPFMGQNIALKGLTVIVLGGMGNIRGAVLGGFVVAGIEVYFTAIGYGWLSEAMVFIALFLILLIRPQGLLGQATIKRA